MNIIGWIPNLKKINITEWNSKKIAPKYLSVKSIFDSGISKMFYNFWQTTASNYTHSAENTLGLVKMSRKVAAALFFLTCFDSIVICKYIDYEAYMILRNYNWIYPAIILKTFVLKLQGFTVQLRLKLTNTYRWECNWLQKVNIQMHYHTSTQQ